MYNKINDTCIYVLRKNRCNKNFKIKNKLANGKIAKRLAIRHE